MFQTLVMSGSGASTMESARGDDPKEKPSDGKAMELDSASNMEGEVLQGGGTDDLSVLIDSWYASAGFRQHIPKSVLLFRENNLVDLGHSKSLLQNKSTLKLKYYAGRGFHGNNFKEKSCNCNAIVCTKPLGEKLFAPAT